MYEHLLESAEFYHKRHHNFASKIILPIFGLFIFLLCFLVFMKKEITVKTVATVEPIRLLSQIQSTSNNKIKMNHLEEGQVVKKGEVLVEYEHLSESIQQSTAEEQLELFKKQREQLGLLKASFEQGVSQFPESDGYGYLQRFEDYLSQRETISQTVHQQNNTIANQNTSSFNTQGAIGELLDITSQKITDYQVVRSAIESGHSVDSINSGYSIYRLYTTQLSSLTTESERSNLKHQVISQIDTQLQQLTTELASHHIQYASSGTQQAYNTSLESQLASLRSQKVTEVSQELMNLGIKIAELESNIKRQQVGLDATKIIATESGIIHINKEIESSQLVPSGTIIASLYPILEAEKKIRIEAYIPSRDISSLAVGDKVNFKTQDSSNKEIILNSIITQIDSTATKTESGNVFKITADTVVSDRQVQSMKYGMEGRLVIVTGEKTYLDYYLDKFFD